jgi:threonine synthase
MNVSHLSCFYCEKEYPAKQLYQLCPVCNKPLKVNYDLLAVAKTLSKTQLVDRPANLWRYRELLPVTEEKNIVCLGEGFTPLLHAENLGKKLQLPYLYIKDEGLNPTGSFKARGIALAVSMAKELGVKTMAMPTAGNAGSALAAYAARAGLEAYIFMPQDVPLINRIEMQIYGAKTILINGLITDCGKAMNEHPDRAEWFDASTLKEPYRVEGKKTMGYELAEQLQWQLPHVIIYPTGGGTGLIGMWKAFEEMEQLGWIGSKRPRMISVQAEGCAPIVRAFIKGENSAEEHKDAHTIASGLRVPRAIGDFIMLDILRKSGGTAIAVSDQALMEAAGEISRMEGVFAAPEGGATLAALHQLLANGMVKEEERIVLFNTGTGIKYLEAFQ